MAMIHTLHSVWISWVLFFSMSIKGFYPLNQKGFNHFKYFYDLLATVHHNCYKMLHFSKFNLLLRFPKSDPPLLWLELLSSSTVSPAATFALS